MKLCPQCQKTPWPFLFALFIAGFAAFLTWLTTALSDLTYGLRIAASASVFIAVAATLIHYVVSCMKRHCRHNKAHQHRQSRGGIARV